MSTPELIKCNSCGNDMPKLRLTLYGYDFCTKCSTVKPKVGRTLTLGTGDHTWNDLEILDQDVAKRVIELEAAQRGQKVDDLDLLDYNQEDEFDETVELTKEDFKRTTTTFDPDEKPYVEEDEQEE